MQEDVHRGDGLNLYAYCRNNPVIYYDPSGYSHGNKEDNVKSNSNEMLNDYYQDQNGRWHRQNGDFASNQEVGLPDRKSNNSGNERGRLGTEETRNQNKDIGDYLESQGYTITGGGGRRPEEYLPGSNGGNKGSNYLDVTAQKNNEIVRVNTVDVYADGTTPTKREQVAADSIDNKTGGKIILIPKGSGLGELPDIISNKK